MNTDTPSNLIPHSAPNSAPYSGEALSAELSGLDVDALLLLHASGELAQLSPHEARNLESRLANDPALATRFAGVCSAVNELDLNERSLNDVRADFSDGDMGVRAGDDDMSSLAMQTSRRRAKLGMRSALAEQLSMPKIESQPRHWLDVRNSIQLSNWVKVPLAAAAVLAFGLASWMYFDIPAKTREIAMVPQSTFGEPGPSDPDPLRSGRDGSNFPSDQLNVYSIERLAGSMDLDSFAVWNDLDSAAYSASVLAEDVALLDPQNN